MVSKPARYQGLGIMDALPRIGPPPHPPTHPTHPHTHPHTQHTPSPFVVCFGFLSLTPPDHVFRHCISATLVGSRGLFSRIPWRLHGFTCVCVQKLFPPYNAILATSPYTNEARREKHQLPPQCEVFHVQLWRGPGSDKVRVESQNFPRRQATHVQTWAWGTSSNAQAF